MQRYGIINEKNPREIVLLRGSGCVYKKCSFCDYHLDKCSDEAENFALNSSALSKVTGQYGDLEVINSGSVFELDEKTLALISETCHQKNIHTIHFEAHYLFRKRIPEIRERFGDIMLKMKLGLETFDYDLRENCLNKGIPEKNPAVIAEYFDEANFIFGLTGQNMREYHDRKYYSDKAGQESGRSLSQVRLSRDQGQRTHRHTDTEYGFWCGRRR